MLYHMLYHVAWMRRLCKCSLCNTNKNLNIPLAVASKSTAHTTGLTTSTHVCAALMWWSSPCQGRAEEGRTDEGHRGQGRLQQVVTHR